MRQRFDLPSPRQWQVSDMTVDGNANKEIAMDLGVSERCQNVRFLQFYVHPISWTLIQARTRETRKL